jgi:hypothetical protein
MRNRLLIALGLIILSRSVHMGPWRLAPRSGSLAHGSWLMALQSASYPRGSTAASGGLFPLIAERRSGLGKTSAILRDDGTVGVLYLEPGSLAADPSLAWCVIEKTWLVRPRLLPEPQSQAGPRLVLTEGTRVSCPLGAETSRAGDPSSSADVVERVDQLSQCVNGADDEPHGAFHAWPAWTMAGLAIVRPRVSPPRVQTRIGAY